MTRWSVVLLWLLSVSLAYGGGGPEGVAVVLNSRSWASQAIANQYIAWRKIPASNVVLLDVDAFERIGVDDFREQILRPTLATLQSRGVLAHIDCVAYSSDLPTAVDVRSDIGQLKLPRVITPVASINGLTYLYQQVLRKDANYLQLNSNRYMRLPELSTPAKPLTADQRRRLLQASQSTNSKLWAQAAKQWEAIVAELPGLPAAQYNLACCLARLNKPQDALAALRSAVQAGWSDRRHTQRDADLLTLRKEAKFQEILREMELLNRKPLAVQPTAGFRGVDQWDNGGQRVHAGGRRYLLSTVLGVTSGRGNSVSEVLAALRRSVDADGTRPSGTIYFPTNGNVRSTTRDGRFHAAAAALRDLQVSADVRSGVLPKGRQDVMGAMVGAASFDFVKSGSRILPGAICEHLTSFGGVMTEGAGQTPLSEWIRHGAAGTSGAVTEPFALQAKFPFPYLHVHYARGCSLAEAFYQSIHGPYQLLVVGDPLCQPWARIGSVDVPQLAEKPNGEGRRSFAANLHGSSPGEPRPAWRRVERSGFERDQFAYRPLGVAPGRTFIPRCDVRRAGARGHRGAGRRMARATSVGDRRGTHWHSQSIRGLARRRQPWRSRGGCVRLDGALGRFDCCPNSLRGCRVREIVPPWPPTPFRSVGEWSSVTHRRLSSFGAGRRSVAPGRRWKRPLDPRSPAIGRRAGAAPLAPTTPPASRIQSGRLRVRANDRFALAAQRSGKGHRRNPKGRLAGRCRCRPRGFHRRRHISPPDSASHAVPSPKQRRGDAPDRRSRVVVGASRRSVCRKKTPPQPHGVFCRFTSQPAGTT